MYSPSTPFSEYLRGEQIKYPELTYDAIQTLMKSSKEDRNLPPISEKMYLAFLHSTYFDMEQAKITIKKYYFYHFDIPKVFCNLDPSADEIKKYFKCISLSELPSVNLNRNNRMVYIQFKDTNPELLEYVPYFQYIIMWIKHSLLSYGTSDGLIIVINSDGLNWRHVVKIPIGLTVKILTFLECGLPFRLKGIHFLNTGSATRMLMKIITRFANPDLTEKIKTHAVGSEDIFNYVPRNMLPVEVGGTAESHLLSSETLYKNMMANRNYFLEENEMLNNHMKNKNR